MWICHCLLVPNKRGNIGTTYPLTEIQWKLVLMREMQCRAGVEFTAVSLRVLITCYTGRALAHGKVLGTKPEGVFAPAIRPSLPSPHNQAVQVISPWEHSSTLCSVPATFLGARCWKSQLLMARVLAAWQWVTGREGAVEVPLQRWVSAPHSQKGRQVTLREQHSREGTHWSGPWCWWEAVLLHAAWEQWPVSLSSCALFHCTHPYCVGR